jgi:DNA-binding MarR family transcriptional regulator
MVDLTQANRSPGSIVAVDRDAAARQIIESIGQLFFSAENQVRFHGTADELGLAPPMLKALLDLRPGEGRAMRELAGEWGCDASFVTVTCDGLEAKGYVERRVAEHDRRVKMVELTPAGIEAQAWAASQVYGPRAGFDVLTADEQQTLARLLVKVAAAQDAHDRAVSADPKVRATARQMSAQRTREFRAQPSGGGREPWSVEFEAHRRELADLRDELTRMRDELKAQVRQPVDQVKAAKAEIKARARRPVDQAKAAKADIKADIKARVKGTTKGGTTGGGRPRGDDRRR